LVNIPIAVIVIVILLLDICKGDKHLHVDENQKEIRSKLS